MYLSSMSIPYAHTHYFKTVTQRQISSKVIFYKIDTFHFHSRNYVSYLPTSSTCLCSADLHISSSSSSEPVTDEEDEETRSLLSLLPCSLFSFLFSGGVPSMACASCVVASPCRPAHFLECKPYALKLMC